MSNDITARKNGQWTVLFMAPDVCKTPVGSAIVPIPYPVVAKLGDAVKTVPNVKANGDPVLTISGHIPTTLGDQAGVQKGIKSGTVGKAAFYRSNQHSSTVRAGKQRILRHGDLYWMNSNPPSGKSGKAAKSNEPTHQEIELAKLDGVTPAQIAAREKVARHYLEENEFSDSQITDALGSKDGKRSGGIDLSKPVSVVKFPPPDKMTQHVMPHGFPGNWFDPKGNQSPDSLGISAEGRKKIDLLMPKGTGLVSHSKPIIDTWTNPSNPISTSGGGTQVFINDNLRKKVVMLNKIGN